MVHIKESLLLIDKSSPCSGDSGKLTILCPMSYNHIKNVLSVLLNKTFPSFFLLPFLNFIIVRNNPMLAIGEQEGIIYNTYSLTHTFLLHPVLHN